MADLAIIGLSIDSSGAERGAQRIIAQLDLIEKRADSAVAAVARVGTSSTTASSQIGEAAGATSRLSGAIGLATGLIGAATVAVSAFVAGLGLLQKRGLEINETLESSTLGIASLIASLNTLKSGDVELKGVDALNAAIPLATEQMQKLRIAGLQTAATTTQLVDAFQQAIGAGSAAGLTLDQVRNFTVDIVQAAGALKLPYQQVSQEVRTILEGTIDQNARIAKALGITNAMVKDWREQGRLAEELNKRLEIFRASGEKVAKTFAGVKSNFQEAIDVIGGAATLRTFDAIRDRLGRVTDSLLDSKNLDIDAKLKPLLDLIDRISEVGAKKLFDVFDGIINWLKEIGDTLKRNKIAVDEVVGSFDLLLDRVGDFGASLLSAFGGNGASLIKAIRTELDRTATDIALLQDAVELFGAAFLYTLQAIVLGIEGPLKSALGLFGIQIQALDNDVQRLMGSMNAAQDRWNQGFRNTRNVETEIAARDRFNAASPEDRARAALFLDEFGSGALPRGASVPATREFEPPKPRATVTPRRPAGDNASDKKAASDRAEREAEREMKALADAQFALLKSAGDREFALEKDNLERQLDLLKENYDQRLVTVEQYYSEKTRLETASVNAELLRLVELSQQEQERRRNAKTESERVRIDAELVKLSQQKTVLERQLGDIQRKNSDDYLAALARRAAEERKAAEALAEAAAETARRRQGIQTDLLFDRLNTRTNAVNVDRDLGLISEAEARRKILDIQREMRDELEASLKADLGRALLAEDPRRVEAIKQELDNLRLLGEELTNVQRLKRGLFDEQSTGDLLEGFGRDIRSTISGAFRDGFEQGPKAFFSSLITGFRNALAQLASELLTSAFLKLLRSLLGGLGGGSASGGGTGGTGGGGGILGGIFGFISSAIGGLFGGGGFLKGGSSTITGQGASSLPIFEFRASGGSVSAQRPYVVGERGMELFVPQTNGYIVPNHQLTAMKADHPAQTINAPVTVVVQGVRNPQEFAASADQVAAKLAEAVERSLRMR